MSQPKCVAVMGPDRVGKSTLIENLKDYLLENNKKVEVLHFSGPKPEHNSPIDQYTHPLEQALSNSPDFIICDRFGAEVCFYEDIRRNIRISEEWAKTCESYFMSRTNLDVYLVQRPWSWSLPHHKEEILSLYPQSTEWFIDMQLQNRHYEHISYYAYMESFMEKGSIVEGWNIIKSEDPQYLVSKYS